MDLINQLTQNLGVSQSQAREGTGLIMRLARENLGTGEFTQIKKCIPDVESFIKSAPVVTGTEKALGNISKSSVPGAGATNLLSLTNGFSKIGLDSSMVERFVPIVLSFVQERGGDNTRRILETLLRK